MWTVRDMKTVEQVDVAPSYAYAGITLSPAIAAGLIQELFTGCGPVRREQMVTAVVNRHLEQGGLPGRSAAAPTVNKALQSLRAAQMVTNPSIGHWVIGEQPAAKIGNERPPRDPAGASAASKPDPAEAYGAPGLYVYYYPAYRTLANMRGEGIWPCKVGRSSVDIAGRVASQSGTALPERPVLVLAVLTPQDRDLEAAVHATLRLRGKGMPDSPGSEWFLIDPDEVAELVRLLHPGASILPTPQP